MAPPHAHPYLIHLTIVSVSITSVTTTHKSAAPRLSSPSHIELLAHRIQQYVYPVHSSTTTTTDTDITTSRSGVSTASRGLGFGGWDQHYDRPFLISSYHRTYRSLCEHLTYIPCIHPMGAIVVSAEEDFQLWIIGRIRDDQKG